SNQSYIQTLAATGGSGTGYVWQLASGSLPTGWSVTQSTGAVGGVTTQSGTFNFTVSVTDSAGGTTSKPFVVTITAPLALTTDHNLGTTPQGVPITATFAANGGVPPYQWSMAGGGVPGVTLTSGGGLTGSPTQQGSFSFTVGVTDSKGAKATKDFSLTV